MNVGLVVTTLGRLDRLRRLFDSLRGQLTARDRLVVVAQGNVAAVERLAAEYRSADFPVTVTTSERGASRGRNAGVQALPPGIDYLLHFPNDSSWYPPETLARLRALPDHLRLGALTVVDDAGPKFVLPMPGTPLDRWNVWSVIEMGLLIRRTAFDQVDGFNPDLGTGASTPWQAGEVTDLLFRLMSANRSEGFSWQPPSLFIGGITETEGLTTAERRRKLRGYGRGLGRLVARWRYPAWWRAAFTLGGLLFGVRHLATHRPLDGWWVFLGRFEGAIGHTVGRTSDHTAVSR